MKLPRIVRQIGKRVVKAAPILRRHILASTDYHVLSGADEARNDRTMLASCEISRS